MTWLYDSHIHLSDREYQPQIPVILRSMEKLKVKACCVSMDCSNSEETLQLANQSKLILPFLGIHPERASDNLEKIIGLIERNSKKIYGIGEIGLDRTYSSTNDDFNRQKEVFETQLSLAEKLKKPVSIHSRKTLDDIFEIIPSYSTKILLHWFDGNKKQLNKAMDMNLFVSYGPVMIYANDKQVLLSKTDEDKFLIETDGPVRFSGCFRSKTAQIDFIPSVLFCASKVLRKSYEDTAKILEKNSVSYLGI